MVVQQQGQPFLPHPMQQMQQTQQVLHAQPVNPVFQQAQGVQKPRHAVISPSQFRNKICRPCSLCDLTSVPPPIACIFNQQLGEPWDGAVCGTLMFMAPEVHRGHMSGSSIKSTMHASMYKPNAKL